MQQRVENFDSLKYYTCINILIVQCSQPNKFVIKCFNPTLFHMSNNFLSSQKLRCRKIHREIHSLTLSLSLENLTSNVAKKLFFKKGELTLSNKPNTRFENYFHHLKIPTWLVIQKYYFSRNNNKIIQSKLSQ